MVNDRAVDAKLFYSHRKSIIRSAWCHSFLHRFSRDLSLHKQAAGFKSVGEFHDGTIVVLVDATPSVLDDPGSLHLCFVLLPVQK